MAPAVVNDTDASVEDVGVVPFNGGHVVVEVHEVVLVGAQLLVDTRTADKMLYVNAVVVLSAASPKNTTQQSQAQQTQDHIMARGADTRGS